MVAKCHKTVKCQTPFIKSKLVQIGAQLFNLATSLLVGSYYCVGT